MGDFFDDTEEVVEHEEDNEMFMLRVMDKKQKLLFEKITEVISEREDVSEKLIGELVKKISSSISGFVRELRGIKIEAPEAKQPIVNVQLDNVAAAIEAAARSINESQVTTNTLLQTLIDGKITEWKLTVDKLDAAGRISEVTFKGTK